MSIETMKQALEALENSYAYLPVKTGVEREVDKAISALRQAIEFEEMVQKGTKAWADTPDDWVDELRDGAEKREWVGLTEKDLEEIDKNTTTKWAAVLAGETKLREKNA